MAEVFRSSLDYRPPMVTVKRPRKIGLIAPGGRKIHQAQRYRSVDQDGEEHRWWVPRCGAHIDPALDFSKPYRKWRTRHWKSAPISGPEMVTCQRCARMMHKTWPYIATRLSEDPVVWVATHGEGVEVIP